MSYGQLINRISNRWVKWGPDELVAVTVRCSSFMAIPSPAGEQKLESKKKRLTIGEKENQQGIDDGPLTIPLDGGRPDRWSQWAGK